MYQICKPLILKLFATDVTPPEIPGGANLTTAKRFQAAPSFLKYQLIMWALVSSMLCLVGLVITIITFAEADPVAMIVGAGIDIFLAFIIFTWYFVVRIDYDMRTYIVTDRGLRIREGAWLVREMTLTYANVQNVKVEQGPLQRMFNIKNLQVETAGGGGSGQGEGDPYSYHTGNLRGISNAEEVRDLIQKYMDKLHKTPETPETPNVPGSTDEGDLYREILQQTRRLAQNLN